VLVVGDQVKLTVGTGVAGVESFLLQEPINIRVRVANNIFFICFIFFLTHMAFQLRPV
jgi:hypothetical protein